MDMNHITTSSELCHHILGKEFRVASCHIDIDITKMNQPVQNTIEPYWCVRISCLLLGNCILYLIDEHIVFLILVSYT
ncbi:hypothetical protein SDC9_81657 [bioreactor metagenome]|uniref:Uncharacterized protein n=1 Tax=bioreactor metagenome TaxID=1076179 RepID=A0A644Z396_9ZZZZ